MGEESTDIFCNSSRVELRAETSVNMALWGNKNDDDPDGPVSQNGDSSSHVVLPRASEADERTRLLPPPSQGYLSPDDPAVSPYNLWSVRFLRYFTVLFAIITFLWWVLLLVSIFVSPPGIHSRGSGFFDFSYTTLTLGLLILNLLFFSSPSKAAQVSCLIVAVVLLVDSILVVSVPRLRVEEGWVGIASVLWALLIAVWTVTTDRIVAWGKREEEERFGGMDLRLRFHRLPRNYGRSSCPTHSNSHPSLSRCLSSRTWWKILRRWRQVSNPYFLRGQHKQHQCFWKEDPNSSFRGW